jgi:hypothetical protein
MSKFAAMKMNSIRALVAALTAVTYPAKSWAAVATAVTAGFTAQFAGADPWPWVIGGFGAAIVYVKKQGKSRLDAITNALISVLIGGLVTPLWVAPAVAKHLGPELANQYALAFIFSAAWPWLVPLALSKMKSAKLPGDQQ